MYIQRRVWLIPVTTAATVRSLYRAKHDPANNMKHAWAFMYSDIFLSQFKQIWTYSTYFHKSPPAPNFSEPPYNVSRTAACGQTLRSSQEFPATMHTRLTTSEYPYNTTRVCYSTNILL